MTALHCEVSGDILISPIDQRFYHPHIEALKGEQNWHGLIHLDKMKSFGSHRPWFLL
jgi:hypothetical protein